MKKDITKLICIFFTCLFGCLNVSGQESHEVYIRFRVNKSTLDETLGDNAARLSEVIAFIEKAHSDSVLQFVDISFCGSASPEGPLLLNRKLSVRRRKALEDYIRSKVSFPLRDSIVTRCDGAIYDWELLTQLVEASDMPHKEEAIDVIRLVPEFTYNNAGKLTEKRKKRLMQLRHGSTWKYMLRHFYPRLRYGRLVLQTVRPEAETRIDIPENMMAIEGPAVAATPPLSASVVTSLPPSVQKRGHNFIFAVKTNLLYDALTIPNLGVEVLLPDRWTVHANWMWGWWKNNFSRRYFLRAYGGELSVRRYLGGLAARKPFSGHHVGIYGQIFTHDFRNGSHGYMGGKPKGTMWDKMSYAVGAEYGYSVPLCRRLNLDFTLGVGYMTGIIHDYTPLDGCKVWQRTRTRRWFGPTKAEISLVWIIGKGGDHE